MKAALLAANRAEPRERTRRMRAMRKQVMENDVAAWARGFLDELADTVPAHGKQVRPPKKS